jgi:RHS repeat-associated protein
MTSTSNVYNLTTGLLASTITDGRETDFTYDYLDRVATTSAHPTASLVLTATNVFDRYHLLQSVDYYGRATNVLYDLLDRPIVSQVQLTPGGLTITNSTQYNAAGMVSATFDGNNNQSRYLYDARNRRTVATVAYGTALAASTTATYDGNSNVLQRIDEKGNAWVSAYSSRNKLLSSADPAPLNDTTYYSYTSDALVYATTNANGNVTTNSYQSCCARLASVTDASGNFKTFSYDFNGNTTQVVDESLRTVSFLYDGINRQTVMIAASGSLNLTSSAAYFNPATGSIGQHTVATNPAGQQITTWLDGMARVVSTSGNISPTSYGYDTLMSGYLLSTVTVGSGSTVLLTSALTDGAGRTVTTYDGLGKATPMTYDNNANLLTTTDPDSRVVTNTWDARDRMLTSVGDATGISATTSFSYDPTNNLTDVYDPELKHTQYQHDNANRRTQTTYAVGTSDSRSWTMTYKPLGQIATLTKPSGVIVTYSYEPRELLSSRVYGGTAPSATDSFTYYPNQLLSGGTAGLYNMCVSRGTASYDAANRLVQETETFGATVKSVSYAYTADSLVSQTVYPDGTVAGRSYNDHRLLFQTLIGSGTQATFVYDPADRRGTMTYANSAVTTWTLDADSRVTGLNVTASGGTLQAWGYGYNATGDLLSQADLTPSYGTMGEAYQYDGLHRVSAFQRGQVSGTNSVTSPSSSQSWTLTKAGDWSQWISNVGTLSTSDSRTHNNIHALTSRTSPSGSQSYDFDSNQTDDGTQYKFVYDANDQLQQVLNCGTLALVASYAYDAFGRRTQKYVAGSSAATAYYYADKRVVQEYVNGAGTASASYTYGDYIDEPLTMNRGGNLYYYHANRMHGVYLLTNSAGGIAERYSYTPYGVVAVSNSTYTSSGTVSSVGSPYLFTGREIDPESGLYNYRARTYDPVQGRFKQLDPIGLDGGANLYRYCGDSLANANNPIGTW